ncbi:hypothetical protein A2U01_0065243, partial [Trifolium medium]|nr:hypothetical protein [Trifolium medium]
WNKKKADKANETVSDTEDNNDVEVENEQIETGTNTIDETEDNDASGESNVNQDSNEDLDDDSDDEPNQIQPRNRRPPEYLRDYVTGREQEENESDELQNLAMAMFNTSEDP